MLQLTGSGAAVGLVILCFDLPGVVTGAILGRLLDRYQPRLVMGYDNLARAALIAAIPTLYALGSLQLWHVFVLALLAGGLSPATAAGVRAFVPHLVDAAALDRANALTATSLQFSYLAGPVAAGFAVARLGGPWALFIDAASFLLMGLLVLTLPTITREPRVAQQRQPIAGSASARCSACATCPRSRSSRWCSSSPTARWRRPCRSTASRHYTPTPTATGCCGPASGRGPSLVVAAGPLGAAFGGVLLQYLSAPRVIAISGLACILAGLSGLASPSLRQLQRGSS